MNTAQLVMNYDKCLIYKNVTIWIKSFDTAIIKKLHLLRSYDLNAPLQNAYIKFDVQ